MPTPANHDRAPARAFRCPARRGRWRRPAQVMLVPLAVALAGVVIPVAHAAPARPATAGSSAATTVTGPLQRVVREAGPGHHGSPSTPSTWIVPDGAPAVPVAPAGVAGVPAGSRVTARLGPAGPDGVRPVAELTVETRTRAAAVTTADAAHRVTVVLALPPGAAPDATTPASLSAAVTSGAGAIWSARSEGRIRFTVERAVDWLRVRHDCSDVWGVWDDVRAAVGTIPTDRRHLLVYVPPGAGCPTGLSTVATSPADGGYVMVGATTPTLLAHELGHNLGLGHSDALRCDAVEDGVYRAGWPVGCSHEEYGDWYDIMGISWENAGSLSAAHAAWLGLLPPAATRTVTTSQSVVLQPVSGRAGVRALRVAEKDGGTYVVEFRPARGADAWLGTGANWRGLTAGVLVRRIDPEQPTRTLLLDTSPSPAATADDDHDPALGLGARFVSASGRLTLRVTALTSERATISVTVTQAATAPSIVLEPRGRLIDGAQVTVGDAPAAWAAHR